MAKLNLRERFQQFDVKEIATASDFATWAYNLLEALVEAVEPEDTEATIRKLREERDGANEKLEIRRTLCQSWEGRCHKAERELAEAKAEIERLRHQLLEEDDRFRHIRARLTGRRKYWQKQCLKAKDSLAQLEILSADAALGRLVRNLPWGAKLSVHGYDLTKPHYMAFRWNVKLDGYVLIKDCVDPAEALRSIQARDKEEGDAEA